MLGAHRASPAPFPMTRRILRWIKRPGIDTADFMFKQRHDIRQQRYTDKQERTCMRRLFFQNRRSIIVSRDRVLPELLPIMVASCLEPLCSSGKPSQQETATFAYFGRF